VSNHPKNGRARKRKPVARYTAPELHALAVDDYCNGVHTHGNASLALAWFAHAIERIAHLRGISKDQAFLEVRHDAEVKAGRPLL
jgi:hypothetical protein